VTERTGNIPPPGAIRAGFFTATDLTQLLRLVDASHFVCSKLAVGRHESDRIRTRDYRSVDCAVMGAIMNHYERPLTDDEALACLLAQPDGRTETSVSALARQWHWNRTKVFRRLKRWANDGHIAHAVGSDGRSVITAMISGVHKLDMDGRTRRNGELETAVAAVANTYAERAEQVERTLFRTMPTRRPRLVLRTAASFAFAVLAAMIAWFGIRINAWYGATLGKTAEASNLMAGLSVSADILAFALPAAARALWVERYRAAGAVAWLLWSITIVITLMATIGFAALNVADTTAARGKIAADAAVLMTRIERLRPERASITETRSVATIEAELQRAQPRAAAVWRATAGCRDVTLPESGEACATVLSLRQALGTAQRRDNLDAALHAAEAELARLPPITTADPQADIAVRLVNWVSFGAIKLSPNDIAMARIAGMTLMPQIAGLVLMLAVSLWQSGRCHVAALIDQ